MCSGRVGTAGITTMLGQHIFERVLFVFIVTLAQTRVTWKEGISVEELALFEWPVGMFLRDRLD